MSATTRLLLYLTTFVVTTILCSSLSIQYSYSDLKDYATVLTGVSGMVFTIMGIWIAFLYPNALSRLVDPKKIETADFSETLDDARRLESIVAAVLQSALVMVIVLLMFLAKTFIYPSIIYSPHIPLYKAISAGTIITTTLVQLDAVFMVILANIMFINDLHTKRRDRKSEASG